MVANRMKLTSSKISLKQHQCFVIAEAGVNHGGSIQVAMELIRAAADAGADAVKFQTWVTEKLVHRDAELASYQKKNQRKSKSQFDMLKSLELDRSSYKQLKTFAKQCGIIFLSTPDEEDSADFLDALGVPMFKIGSGEVTNLPFLAYVARKGRPVILSTGMSTLGEVEKAVMTIEQVGNRQLTILHCVSNYPADPRDCNLRAMLTLQQAFGYPVGYSDHCLGSSVVLASVALGAKVIEKHLTLDCGVDGPDHRASMEPAEFALMVRGIREVESSLGDGRKVPTPAELKIKRVVQKSLVAAGPLKAGHILAMKDLKFLRTSGAIPVSLVDSVLGRKLRRSLPASAPIAPSDFC